MVQAALPNLPPDSRLTNIFVISKIAQPGRLLLDLCSMPFLSRRHVQELLRLSEPCMIVLKMVIISTKAISIDLMWMHEVAG